MQKATGKRARYHLLALLFERLVGRKLKMSDALDDAGPMSELVQVLALYKQHVEYLQKAQEEKGGGGEGGSGGVVGGADPPHPLFSGEMVPQGATPLHFAFATGSLAAVELLVRAGADASLRTDAGATCWEPGHSLLAPPTAEASAGSSG